MMVFKARKMRNCLKLLLACLPAFVAASGCASKKHEIQLAGIQNQITYLTDSYKKLSMNIAEIQDTLLVVQTRVDLLKDTDYALSLKNRDRASLAKRKETSGAKMGGGVSKEESLSLESDDKDDVPVFELGMHSSGMQGKPGDVFTLKDGEGYIKIEGDSAGRALKTTSVKTETQSKPEVDLTITPREFYEDAYKAYSGRKFDKAIKRFSDFLKIFPEHDLSDNALYWIGESYVGKGEYALALPEFQRVQMEYPNGNKVPDSLLMMGICFEKLDNRANAKESWKKLVMLFPDTIAAKKAKNRLETFD